MVNASRLKDIWLAWAPQAGMTGASVSVASGEMLFKSADYTVDLRTIDEGWAIDTIDDRGQRHNDVAKFSTFELAEKYLIWEWASLARSSLASGPLGANLYKLGYAPGIKVSELSEGNIELSSDADWVIMVIGDAAIFSHIMNKSLDEILNIAGTAGLQAGPAS
jgi:hypothetical protein